MIRTEWLRKTEDGNVLKKKAGKDNLSSLKKCECRGNQRRRVSWCGDAHTRNEHTERNPMECAMEISKKGG